MSVEHKPRRVKSGNSIILQFKDNYFMRVKSNPEKGITLILDLKKQVWILMWSKDVGLVYRRAAEGQARSLINTGYSNGEGAREGRGLPLELVGA